MHSVSGLAGGEVFQVLNNSINNMERGVMMRVFMYYDKIAKKYVEVPRPLPGVVKQTMMSFKIALLKFRKYATPIPLEEIPGRYQGAKKLMKERAVIKLLETGYLIKYSYCTIFVKAELYNFSRKSWASIDPRVIQPLAQEHLVLTATYILSVEHKIYNAINELCNQYNPTHPSPTIMLGNVIEQAEAIAQSMRGFNDPVVRGADASRYDMCISEDMMRWEIGVICEFFENKADKQELKKLLQNQINRKCFGRAYDGSIQYRTNGTRPSGAQDTALSNKLTMTAMWVVFMVDYMKITHFALKDAGDDILVICEREDMAKIEDWMVHEFFAALGFRIVLEDPAFCLEDVEFCQMHPVFDGETHKMVRDPRVATTKDSMRLEQFKDIVDYCGWVDSVGQCGLALCSGIPMMQSYYCAMIRGAAKLKQSEILDKGITREYKPSEKDKQNSGLWWARNMHAKARIISEEARYSFWKAFGIPPEVQRSMEDYYDNFELRFDGLEIEELIERHPFHEFDSLN